MKKIIFLQSKLPDDLNALRQLSDRWKSYGEILKNQGEVGGIWIVTPQPLSQVAQDILVSNFVRQFPTVDKHQSVILRLNALRKELKAERRNATLVCGDNQQSLIVALSLKILLNSRLRFQIQFHGNTYSFGVNKGLVGFVRVCLSRMGIFTADSIRVVSRFQMNEIRNISKGAGEKFVHAPIPIDFSKVAGVSKEVKFDLAFIGRFHEERGIGELVRIINLVKNQRPNTTVAIVGEGPLKNFIEVELAKWLKDSTVSMPGFLPSEEILDLYASTRVLVSTAPNEGYGLTLREAALSNVYVVAQESMGAIEAKLAFPSRIVTFTSVEEGTNLILGGFTNSPIVSSVEDIERQSEYDFAGLERLAKSWIDF
jgi:glycosyltransferase involved in cell wall biosynthesis